MEESQKVSEASQPMEAQDELEGVDQQVASE